MEPFLNPKLKTSWSIITFLLCTTTFGYISSIRSKKYLHYLTHTSSCKFKQFYTSHILKDSDMLQRKTRMQKVFVFYWKRHLALVWNGQNHVLIMSSIQYFGHPMRYLFEFAWRCVCQISPLFDTHIFMQIQTVLHFTYT